MFLLLRRARAERKLRNERGAKNSNACTHTIVRAFPPPYTPPSHQPIKTQNSPFWPYMVRKPNRRPDVLVQRTYTNRSTERFCSIPLVSETVKRSISVTIFRPLNRKTIKQPRSVKFYLKESQSTCRMGSTPDFNLMLFNIICSFYTFWWVCI